MEKFDEQSSLYDEMMVTCQKRADQDQLYSIIYGHEDIDPHVVAVGTHIQHLAPNIVKTILEGPHREPKIALLFFGIWLNVISIDGHPSRMIPFRTTLDRHCKAILYGKFTNLQDFVWTTAAEYMIGPSKNAQ